MIGARRTLVAAVIVAVGVAAWQLWPTDARRIRRKLDAIAATVNERPADGVGQVARTARLARFVTDDVVLDPGEGAESIKGRERLLALASRVPNEGEPFELSFVDVSIQVTGERLAGAHLTATLTTRDRQTGEETVDAREVELEFRRSDDWRVARITLTDARERPQP